MQKFGLNFFFTQLIQYVLKEMYKSLFLRVIVYLHLVFLQENVPNTALSRRQPGGFIQLRDGGMRGRQIENPRLKVTLNLGMETVH